MPPCPDDLTLATAADGPPGPAREALLAHAADCPACRAALAEFSAADPDAPAALSPAGLRAARNALPRSRRSWIAPWVAAAAALLLAIPLLRFGTGPGAGPPAAPPTLPGAADSPFPAVSATPLLRAEAADLELPLGRSGTAVLRHGARARWLEAGSGAALKLLEGTLWVEAPGERIAILAGEAAVSAEEATFLVEMPGPGTAASLFLRKALAGEAPGRLRVLSGSAMVSRPGAAPVRVAAGQELPLDAGRPSPIPAGQPLAWRGDAGWERLPGSLPTRLREGRLTLVPGRPGTSYVWETRFRRAGPSAGASVCFEAGGRGWELPLGGALGEGTGWIRVRVEVRDGWVRVRAGAYEMLHDRTGTLAGRLEPAEPACALRAWGGDLEIADSRWRGNR